MSDAVFHGAAVQGDSVWQSQLVPISYLADRMNFPQRGLPALWREIEDFSMNVVLDMLNTRF